MTALKIALISPATTIFAQASAVDNLPSPFKELLQTAGSLWELFTALLAVLVPWTPLAAWIAFWLLAVNWIRLRQVLARGGWIGLVLIGAVAVLVWGYVSPGSGAFDFFGLRVSNFVEKTIYVSGLVCLMFLCGALQLAGFSSDLCQ